MRKKNVWRRVGALALIVAMTMSAFTACSSKKTGTSDPGVTKDNAAVESTDGSGNTAAGGEDYSTKLTFTVLSLDYPDGFDDFPLVKEAKEKFNVDFQVQLVAWDNWDETVRTLAATSSLPEVLAWYNLNYGEYLQYAEQGVLKALPDDLSPWPELQKVAGAMPVFENLRVDGHMYAFPKINNNQPVNEYKNQGIIYRRDWAKAMGYNFEPVQELTYDEFVAYLKDLKAKDPGGLGDKLVPMDYYSGGLTWADAASQFNKYYSSYYVKDGKYVWGGRDKATLDGILALKDLYDAGLLYKDSYADTTSAGTERFGAGRSGVWYGDLSLTGLVDMVDNLKLADSDIEDEDIGSFILKMPDGKIHWSQKDNWWASFAFSSSCSDEIMNRWLAIGNWLMEEEQVEKYAYGIPEEDWTKDENGNVTVKWSAQDIAEGGSKSYISQQRFFQKFFMLEGADKWLEGNPAKRTYLQDEVFLPYYERLGKLGDEGNVILYPVNYDVSFFSGTYKNQYGDFSSDVQSAVIQAVVSSDPEGTWNNFLSTNASNIDAVLQELDKNLLQ